MTGSPLQRAAALLVTCWAAVAAAQSVERCNPYQSPDRLLGELTFPSYVSDIEIVGDLAYVADNRLDVVSLSGPNGVQILHSVAIPAGGIAVAGGLLYVTTRTPAAELIILELVAGAAPAIIGRMPASRGPIAVQDGIALVGGQVIDVSNPRQPKLLSIFAGWPGESFNDVELELPYAHTLSRSGYLIVDLSDPRAPKRLSYVGGFYDHNDLDIQGHFAYIALGAGNGTDPIGLRIYDFADRSEPVDVGGAGVPWSPMRVEVEGDAWFAGLENGAIHIFDLDAPHRARLVETQVNGYGATALAAKGSYLCAASKNGMFRTFDMSRERRQVIQSLDEVRANCLGVASSDEYVVTLRFNYGMSIYRIVGDSLEHLADAEMQGIAREATIAGDYAYVANEDAGIQVISLSGPTLGQIVGGYATPGRAKDVEVRDTLAYVADSSGLVILDRTNPQQLQLVSATATSDPVSSVALFEERLLLASEYGSKMLRSFDISNPFSPRLLVASENFYTVLGVAVEIVGEMAYLVSGMDNRYIRKLSVFDISNPDVLELVGEGGFSGTMTDAVIMGNFLYSTSGNLGVHVTDIRDPRLPKLVATHPVPYGAYGVCVVNDRLLFAGYGGLFSLPPHTECRDITVAAPKDTLARRDGRTLGGTPKGTSVALQPTLLAPYPNPSRAGATVSYRLPEGATFSLSIYDAAGRVVRRLVNGPAASHGFGLVHWDGRDDSGADAASGVYFFRMQGLGFGDSRKLILMR